MRPTLTSLASASAFIAAPAMSSSGRGAYYKEKYGGGRGGGGRGRGRGRGGGGAQAAWRPPPVAAPVFDAGGGVVAPYAPARDIRGLDDVLSRLEGASYGAYKEVQGTAWACMGGEGLVVIDRVQSDAFAAPSRVRVVVSAARAALPELGLKAQRVAAADFLGRAFFDAARMGGCDERTETGGWGGKKGGEIRIVVPSQFVLERTAVKVSEVGAVEFRVTVALPARGRSIEGRWAAEILCNALIKLTDVAFAQKGLSAHVEAVMEQRHLRSQLEARGLCAFAADGAALPRRAGDDDRVMKSCVPFDSSRCGEYRVQLTRRDGSSIAGLGLPAGKVSLICGGGFHGKSTLLQALQVGCYDKIPGDGREGVVTSALSAKIRAEDGRYASSVDISAFLGQLPSPSFDAANFSTLDASGSTSQAASIAEALEAGAQTLLFDEDTCATNFMIRDERMRQLVANEPITPLVDRVSHLAWQGVSSVLVIGGTGDFFAIADAVIVMDSYQPQDATARAKNLAGEPRSPAPPSAYFRPRQPVQPFSPVGRTFSRTMETIQYGDNNDVDLKALEQLVELGQAAAVCAAFGVFAKQPPAALATLLGNLESNLDAGDLDILAQAHGGITGDLARPRKLDIAAAINRCRSIEFRQVL